MKLLFGLNQLAQIKKKTALTIGNFDGVHLGHQALFQRLVQVAKADDLASVVLLFEPQPAEYFSACTAPGRLSSLREKLICLEKLGLDFVCCVRFNLLFAQFSPAQFIQKVILKQFNTRYLLLGHDFRFGKARAGDIHLLEKQLANTSCRLDIYADLMHEGKRISSTCIRALFALGALDKAESLLGRKYSIIGRVIAGDARARQWGFPTANIQINRINSPLRGVFCVYVKRFGQQSIVKRSPHQVNSGKADFKSTLSPVAALPQKLIPGVANIGVRPTIGGRRLLLEVHLLDFSDTLYGECLEVFFLHKLRPELRFESIDALVMQIEHDVKSARQFFSEDKIQQY